LNQAGRVQIEAMAKAGELLAATVQAHRPKKLSQRATLPDGITRDQSSRWQAVARVPAADGRSSCTRRGMAN
jgi:hypothetical protein